MAVGDSLCVTIMRPDVLPARLTHVLHTMTGQRAFTVGRMGVGSSGVDE